jgi:hypothetical protein
MNYANGLYGLPPQEEKGLKDLKSSVYNNMAVVHMKQGKNDRAITDLKMVCSDLASHLLEVTFLLYLTNVVDRYWNWMEIT